MRKKGYKGRCEASTAASEGNTSIKGIRSNRQREQAKTHIDFMGKAGDTDE